MGTKNNPAPNDCYAKAGDDEETFTLLARDPVAPTLIRLWVGLRVMQRMEPEEFAALADDGIETSVAVTDEQRWSPEFTAAFSEEDIAQLLEAIGCAERMEAQRALP